MQNAKQAPPMDADLGNVVSGIKAAQLVPDRLAEAVGQDQFARAHAVALKGVQQAEAGKFAHRMRQHVDADTQFPNFRGALENLDVDTGAMQAQRGCEPGDAAACNQDLHVETPRLR